MEADDGLAIAQGYFQEQGIESIIVTEDKDLLQVPGWHYNPNKNDKPFKISEEQGHFLLWKQVITGDKTDNIPGVSQAIHESSLGTYNNHIKETVEDPKERMKLYKTYPRQELYGDKTAENYLKEFPPDMYPAKVLELYIDKYEDSDADKGYGDLRFYETFDLIFMLRQHENYQTFKPLDVPVDIVFDIY